MTIQEMGAALRARKVSARELTQQSLQRIADTNPRLNAFLTVLQESALKHAESRDQDLARGMDHGPLHGIPIAHKDCVHTKGTRTTYGSRLFADFVPDDDAEIVTRLHNAGAVTIGKTNLHELAYGITSTNPHFGAVHNPWDLDRVPGGSSGGSAAAVAAGVVPFATGTDTGGSIRIPASFCGVVGLKPTYDRVSRQGIMPLGYTLDHIGPITRTVRDAAIAFYAMATQPSGFVPPAHAFLEGTRIGIPANFFAEKLDPEVAATFRKVVQVAAALGAHVTEVPAPDGEALNAVGRVIQLAEVAATFGQYLNRRADFGADILTLLDQGVLIRATEYINAQRVRRMLAKDSGKMWRSLDCMIAPATPLPAPKIGEMNVMIGTEMENVRLAATRLTRPFNVLGWPVLSLPCGFTESGLPIGLQIVGPPNQEDTLFQTGAAMEDALGILNHRPPLFAD